MKYVLFYESADDVASKAPPIFPEHWARCQEFHARGVLELVGAFGDPQTQGSMAIFTTREAAEDFATGDPFVNQGVVRRWEVRDWNEAFTDPQRA
jgi:uncharacterized protein